MAEAVVPKREEFFSIQALTILPGTTGHFDLYLKRGNKYLLYCRKGEGFGEEKLAQVLEVTDFYVPTGQKTEYESYLARNLGEFLAAERVPIKARAKVFFNISASVMQKAFTSRLPKPLTPHRYDEMKHIVRAGIKFLSNAEALRSVSQYISHTYKSYSHSIQTMVLLIAMLRNRRDMEYKDMIAVGMGALLHDIGKTEVSGDILNKNPSELTPAEWEILKTHPAKGIRLCAHLELPALATNCIIFHHEKFDGSGYPGGLTGHDIPYEVRALSIANVYDALTTDKAWAEALSPFEAMRIMRDAMPGAFDKDLYKRLVFVLEGARLMS